MYSRKENYTFTIIQEERFLLISFKLNIMHIRIGMLRLFWVYFLTSLNSELESIFYQFLKTYLESRRNNLNDERKSKLYNLHIFSLSFYQEIFLTSLLVK